MSLLVSVVSLQWNRFDSHVGSKPSNSQAQSQARMKMGGLRYLGHPA